MILGMIQRLEKLKKNAFASCCLFGEDNKNAISGKLVNYIKFMLRNVVKVLNSKKGQGLKSILYFCLSPIFVKQFLS